MSKLLITGYGRGKELADALMKELDIHPKTTWFEVRFGVGEPVTIRSERFVEIKPIAMIRLSDDCPLTDAYRAEMNDWLLHTFGTRH